MNLQLTGKRALVLGSSQGLGLGIADTLAAEGANVVLVGRNAEKLNSEADRISSRGPGKATVVVADLSDSGSAAAIVSAARSALGDIDILVNNGGGPPPGPISAVTDDVWEKQFDMMVRRLFQISGLVLPGMRERGWGRILSIASSGVTQPIPHLGISNTVRASIVAWSKTLSLEVAKDGVTVNTILPGRIHTDRVDSLDAAAAKRQNIEIDEARTRAKAAIPAGRYGKVSEFANVATFLCSEAASYVTGSVVRVDGGAIKSI